MLKGKKMPIKYRPQVHTSACWFKWNGSLKGNSIVFMQHNIISEIAKCLEVAVLSL